MQEIIQNSLQKVLEMMHLQNFNNKYGSVADQFIDFFWRLESCVDRHAPIKKTQI